MEFVDELIPLISFITFSENKHISDLFLNLIGSKCLSETGFKEKHKEFGYSLLKDKNKNDINLRVNKILYEEPKELYFNNLKNVKNKIF